MPVQEEQSDARGRLLNLLSRSPQRRAIVSYLLEGCTRKVIAVRMGRSQHTIDAHLKAIYREVGVADRARLMLLASALFKTDKSPPPPPELGSCTKETQLRN
ncbi:MAG: hypothetical protein HEQ38_13295 [Gemmatimonas sp.]|nr:hypothetical protein [Gemmatimonas sp.]